MKKNILKILIILLVVILVIWFTLLLPAQRVEARTGQPPGLSLMNFPAVGNSIWTAGRPMAVQASQTGLLEIQAIPATAGINFKLGESSYTSDQDGIVTLPLNLGQNYTLAVDTAPANTDKSRYEFNCWSDGTKTDQRSINIANNQILQVGFNVYDKVGMNFTDTNGSPVDPTRLSLISMQSSLGDTYSLPDGQQRWFLASVIDRQANALEPADIQYSIGSVLVDGVIVFNQADQVYLATPGDTWLVTLQLFSMHITARDALFQNRIGNGVALEYPNGELETIPFSGSKDVTINSLEQGNYHIQVTGVSGISSYTPIALSQDQEIDLILPTQLDIAIAFAAGIFFALAVSLLVRLRGRRSPVRVERMLEEYQDSQ
ncbi:MAG TPA: hypothetical protein VKF38_05305 [Anaerolineaceae bacterium]|nr:hypothetical protein [Anaerolineaceae bacterium]